MKIKILLLSLSLLTTAALAQLHPADAKSQQQYLVQTYGLNDEQATAYRSKLANFQSALDNLQKQFFPADQLKKKQKELFLNFSAQVKSIWPDTPYSQWKSTTQHIARLRILSEEMLTDRNKVVALNKYEYQWNQDRLTIRSSNIPEKDKQAKHQKMMDDLETKALEILGLELGRWYIDYRTIEQWAYNDIDKYKISFADALRIAKIEYEHGKNRKAILAVKRHRQSETQELLDACDEQLLQTIKSQLQSTSASKWEQYHNDRLASDLKIRYGLSAAAVTNFKSAYNKYAIEEYKVIYGSKNMSQEEKRAAMEKAAESFCSAVKPLFSDQNYKEWEGRWLYVSGQRLERRLNK